MGHVIISIMAAVLIVVVAVCGISALTVLIVVLGHFLGYVYLKYDSQPPVITDATPATAGATPELPRSGFLVVDSIGPLNIAERLSLDSSKIITNEEPHVRLSIRKVFE